MKLTQAWGIIEEETKKNLPCLVEEKDQRVKKQEGKKEDVKQGRKIYLKQKNRKYYPRPEDG